MKRRSDDINASVSSPPLASSRGKSSRSGLTIHDGLSYMKYVKKVFQDERDKIDTFLVILRDFRNQRTDLPDVVARVKVLFKGHNNLIFGFNIFLPEGFKIALDDDEEEEALPPNKDIEQGLAPLINNIKKRFQHHEDVLKSFLEILKLYRFDKDIAEVYNGVSKFFEDHPDSLEGFFRCFSVSLATHSAALSQAQRCNEPGSVPPPVVAVVKNPQPDKDVASRGDPDHSVHLHVDDAHRAEKRSGKGEYGERRSRDLDVGGEAEEEGVLHHSPKKRKSSESFEAYSGPAASQHYEENNIKESLSKEEDLSSPRNGEEKERESAKEKERSKKDKYMGKYIHELDLSDCVCCTPSYRLLPSDYPLPSVRHRETSEAVFLNDHWVSVKDYSSKHMRRNKYEESLFKCEDDRFELDMLLESAGSTAERGQELLNSITENKISLEEGSFVVEDHFTALNLRCIERLYGGPWC